MDDIFYDDALATPNIEELSDLVIAYAVNTGNQHSRALEGRLRELIVECLLAVVNPVLDNHCRFFSALKARTFGRPCTVWIFTTNYDLLFEVAAARVGVVVENGFCGTTERFFSPARFNMVSGDVAGDRFTLAGQLTVKLVKLHGSISWVKADTAFFERHPMAIVGSGDRVMVLPRRKKVIDTLTEPYNTLFAQARRVLGNECRYLVSCGFSYGDEHINQHLLLPVIQSAKCRVFALTETEPLGMAALKTSPCFSAGFANESWLNGAMTAAGTDFWQFGKFVTLFE